MKLCLDCGNTRIKWGLHTPQGWHSHGAVATAQPEQLVLALPTEVSFSTIVACNVAGVAVASALEANLPLPIRWNSAQARQGGIRSSYDDPPRLGADRWAALLGARTLHDGPCLVVNAGTATTIDLLDGDGLFLGGLILPGLDLMRHALAGNTAQLAADPGHFTMLPRNTADAISSGAVQATLGAIDRQFDILQSHTGAAGARILCLIAGGAAPCLTPHLKLPFRAEPLLILEGLAHIEA